MTTAPSISEMIHHIKLCPPDFLRAPRIKNIGEIHTEALVNDTWRKLAKQPTAAAMIRLKTDRRPAAELLLIQITCYAVSHPFFSELASPAWFIELVNSGLAEVAPLVKAEQWLNDEERAEELARIIMHACRQIPDGETATSAADRFDSVNTVRRLKVIEESKAAIERTRELRRQMAEAKAREAANVYARE